jgi:hypothetical protein
VNVADLDVAQLSEVRKQLEDVSVDLIRYLLFSLSVIIIAENSIIATRN